MAETVIQDIRGIVFDLGGVIVDLEDRRFRQRMEALVGPLDDPALLALCNGLQRGDLYEAEFCASLRAHAGNPSLADSDLSAAWRSQIGSVRRERVDLLQRVRCAGYRTFFLSTTNAPHVEEIQREMSRWLPNLSDPLRESVDCAFLSFEMGMLKPERELYEATIAASGLEADELLFLDDTAGHVLGAQAAGMRALLVAGDGYVSWLPRLLEL